jgi:excisionase family DNA binding protein
MYLTPEEAAERLQVTPKTVRSWLRSDELVGIKIGKSWRIHADDLVRLLDGQRMDALIRRARAKRPEIEWTEGECSVCGEPLPVPGRETPWACRVECKQKSDANWATILTPGTEEYAMHTAAVQVVPYF